ncbi:MAG: hypothetical protein HOK95_05960 [Candidatus Marinimicrobia bacterium]|jgi:hypothetical protein|nr:hypothetical protein [Candidatus Neomarinimicrobiota bacterium]
MASLFTPDEFNTARPSNYQLVFQRLPGVTFHLQTVSLPTVTISEIDVPNPMVEMQVPDVHINYDNLNVSFLVDEGFFNWNEIHIWMTDFWNPERGGITSNINELMTDATLHILSNNGNPLREIVFHDCWPTSLSAVEMTTMADAEPIMCDLDINYTHFTMK